MNCRPILKLIFYKEFQIILFFFIFFTSCNSVYANSKKPNLSKNKSNNLSCQQYIKINSTYYCWDGVKYITTNKITAKEEKNKLGDSSQSNNIQLDDPIDKTETNKLADSSQSNNIQLDDPIDKTETNKLADSSQSNNIQLDDPIDKTKNIKLQITQVQMLNNNYKESSRLLISPIIKRVQDEKPKEYEPNPGLSFGIPSAMGSSWKDVFVSVAYTADYDEGLFSWHTKDHKKVADGSMNFGFGFGDPNESIGGEISVGIISLFSQEGESGFGADGTAGIKFHKAMPSLFNTHAAISWTNPIKWGEATKKDTIYGVISKEFELRPDTKNKFSSLLTLGIGTGSHRSNRTIDDNRNDPNFFGGYGVQILPRASFASSWNGNAFNAGFGLSPFDFPLNFSIGLSDITNNSTNGAQFNINTGYSFRF